MGDLVACVTLPSDDEMDALSHQLDRLSRDERAEAVEILRTQGHVLRWERGRGVRVYTSLAAWDAGHGLSLVEWERRRGQA